MYPSSPSLRAAWATLLASVSAASRIDLEVIDHAYPAPLDDLWAREDMGCVFMCGYPWARRGVGRLSSARLTRPIVRRESLMSDELVLIEKRDRIATMTLNRPPMNPMSFSDL